MILLESLVEGVIPITKTEKSHSRDARYQAILGRVGSLVWHLYSWLFQDLDALDTFFLSFYYSFTSITCLVETLPVEFFVTFSTVFLLCSSYVVIAQAFTWLVVLILCT